MKVNICTKILGENITKSELHPLLTQQKGDEEMDVDSNPFLVDYPLLGISEDSLLQDIVKNRRKLNYFERIVFCLKEERMGRDSIKKLPLGISLPIQEVLSHDYFKSIYVKSSEEEKKVIENWPKEIFKLIEREDLYHNLQEKKKNKEFSEEVSTDFQFSRVSSLNLNKNLVKRRSTLKFGRSESNAFANMKHSTLNEETVHKNKPS